jgi:hypothetical protein
MTTSFESIKSLGRNRVDHQNLTFDPRNTTFTVFCYDRNETLFSPYDLQGFLWVFDDLHFNR